MNSPDSSAANAAMSAARVAQPPARRWLWGAVVAVLGAIVAYSLVHESRKASAPAGVPVTPAAGSGAMAPPMESGHGLHEMGQVPRPAMSADEERYAHALWAIHDQVRSSAVKMTFAGLAYKVGDSDKAAMRAKVQPLIAVFTSARAQAEALKAPASMTALHQDYLKAVTLYQSAARTMSGGGADDGHLLEAHAHSEQASTLLLKVGDTLWPGEYKPN